MTKTLHGCDFTHAGSRGWTHDQALSTVIPYNICPTSLLIIISAIQDKIYTSYVCITLYPSLESDFHGTICKMSANRSVRAADAVISERNDRNQFPMGPFTYYFHTEGGGCPKEDLVRRVAWIIHFESLWCRGQGPKNLILLRTSFLEAPSP